jgi:hypothetical protein
MITRFRPKGGEPRPICTCCGKPYGSRRTASSRIELAMTDPVPPYQGNEFLISEAVNEHSRAKPGVVPYSPEWYRAESYEPYMVVTRETWDGRWWGGYAPFCTLHCALAFARGAYNDGHRYHIVKGD